MGAIYDSVTQQTADLVCKGLKPRSVIFSTEGFSKMLLERDSMEVRAAMQGPTYAGLPHTVDPNQAEDVVVSDQTIEQRTTRQRPAISLRIANPEKPHLITMDIAGQLLTERQLADIVMAHCQPAIDAGTQTPLQRALHTAVVNFGRFE